MPARRTPIQPTFRALPVCYDERVRRLAHASALLARGQERRRLAGELREEMEEISPNPCMENEAKICFPERQEREIAAEKIIL